MKFLIVALVIVALAGVDLALEKTERAELSSVAADYEQTGLRLLQEGHVPEAVEALRQAHTLARRNRDYQLALVRGLTAQNRFSEAEALLNELLQQSSNDGAANLAAAHLMAARGDTEQTESYYHRAIYGEWPRDAEDAQKRVRLELIEFLARINRPQALLAELISLQARPELDNHIQQQIAALFLKAGSPGRAVQVYQSLLAKQGQSGDLYKRLGEAELATGDYSGALSSFLKAFRLNPADNAIRGRMELAGSMASLDPTPRRLSSREKYRRSMRILELADERKSKCTHAEDQTNQVASRPAPAQITNELAESQLSEAEQMWKESLAECGPSTSAKEEPLRLIMLKLGQQ